MFFRLFVLVLAMLSVVFAGCGKDPSTDTVKGDSSRKSVSNSLARAKVVVAKGRRGERKAVRGNLTRAKLNKTRSHMAAVQPKLSEKDKKLVKEIEKWQDEEQSEELLNLDKRVREADGPEVREAFLEAISILGVKAISTFVAYLCDPNEDVANAAMNNFEFALSEIDDEEFKLSAVESVFMTVSKPESLEYLAGELNAADEKLAVETILRIVDSGNKAGAKVAKESYEFITGEEFTTPAAARDWIRNEYVPPED